MNKVKRILMIFLLIVIAVNQADTSEPSPKSEPLPTKQRELKILTWNIYMLPFCSEIHQNCKRAASIAEKIAGYNNDIIVFEEAFDYRARKILRSQLKLEYPFMYGPANDSKFSFKTNSGIWILSKIPLRQLEQIEFRNRFGIDAFARKGAVLLEGEWQGQTFQLLGTHLQANSPDSIRSGQCREIANKLLKKYAKLEIPQIVCGDFNIEFEDQVNYRNMLTLLEAENGSLQGDLQSSYDEIDNKLAQKEHGRKSLIDYILVRNAKAIRNIVRQVFVLKENKENIFSDLSDHYGIEAFVHFDNPTSLALSRINQ
jgi:endonuclease/exonuclease/phosphatase family metal-dependent hydrolase